MNSFHEERLWESFWAIADFKHAYKDLDGVCQYTILAEKAKDDPYNSVGMLLRTFVQAGAKKFITALRFYSWGGLATLDIIALADCPNHKNIVIKHVDKAGWIKGGDEVSLLMPFIVAGGTIAEEGRLGEKFTGTSLDFGSDLFGWNACAVANAAHQIIHEEATESSGDFFKFILDSMIKYKNQDFYENFYEAAASKSHLPAHQIGGLVVMKALDRVVDNEENFLQALVEENSIGLGRTIFLTNVANSINKNKKKD